MTAVSLADLVGVTRQAISQYEAGPQSPHPEVMSAICEKLNFPLSFFLIEPPALKGVSFYRSLASVTKRARRRADIVIEWLVQITQYVGELVELPAVNLPIFDLPKEPVRLSGDDIEELAAQARKAWGLGDGPISNVVWLLENNGVSIARLDLDADKLDGVSQWCFTEGRPYILLSADKDSATRSRFDAAHELAHTLLHRHIGARRLTNPAEYKMTELQAHRFAGAFLFPRRAFIDEVAAITLDSLRVAKQRWSVSIAMMLHRASELQLLSEERAQALWRNYSRRGWRTREPLEDDIEPEKPRVLRKAIELLIEEGVRTPADILTALRLNRTDVEQVTGLRSGYLSDAPNAPIVRLHPGLKGLPTRDPLDPNEGLDEVGEQGAPRDVIPFRRRP